MTTPTKQGFPYTKKKTLVRLAEVTLQGFLTAVLQNHARLTHTPIDQLSFGFKVLAVEEAQELTAAPQTGVYVSGLHLEGARYTCQAICIYSALTPCLNLKQSHAASVHLFQALVS